MRWNTLVTMTAVLMGLGISASSITAPVVSHNGMRAAATANECCTPTTTGTTTGIITGIGTATTPVEGLRLSVFRGTGHYPGCAEMPPRNRPCALALPFVAIIVST